MEDQPMPRFSNAPPADQKEFALPIMRTPAHGKFQAIVTSEDLLGCNTHWWGGRTVPCEAPDCEACREGSPYRWHAYCSAFIPKTAIHVLFECTAQASETLVQYRVAHGTLRGCLIDAYRWRSAPNGRVIIRATPAAQPPDTLPKPPDLLKVLTVIWQLNNGSMTKGEHGPYGQYLDPAHRRQPIPDNPNQGAP
jgi:hypothetical protein